jgi:hypothetical protein
MAKPVGQSAMRRDDDQDGKFNGSFGVSTEGRFKSGVSVTRKPQPDPKPTSWWLQPEMQNRDVFAAKCKEIADGGTTPTGPVVYKMGAPPIFRK